MFNKHFLWLFQNVSILTEPSTNHDASLFLRATSLLPYHFYRQEQTLPLLYTPRSKYTRTNKSTLFSTECREKGASQRIHMAMPEPAQPGTFTSGTFQ